MSPSLVRWESQASLNHQDEGGLQQENIVEGSVAEHDNTGDEMDADETNVKLTNEEEADSKAAVEGATETTTSTNQMSSVDTLKQTDITALDTKSSQFVNVDNKVINVSDNCTDKCINGSPKPSFGLGWKDVKTGKLHFK